MRLLAVSLLGATLGFATATQAAQAPAASPTTDDARCLVAMVALSNSKDPNAQRLGQGGVVYFTGRISARDPNFDFARLKTIATTMNAQTAQTELEQRCGPMFNRSIQQLQTALSPPAAPPPPSAPPSTPPKR